MTDTARVILLTGPSGSGKTSLAARTGLPVLRLDDFYKNAGAPDLPKLPNGATDWDSPGSWDSDAAMTAVHELCDRGQTVAPVYDIASSSRVGESEVVLGGSPLFVAEGIFAAQIAARCDAVGLLADALCLRGRPSTTFRRRLFRDVREGRKSLPVLVWRGWRLMREEPRIVRQHAALGARPCRRQEALAAIRAAGRARSEV